MEMVSKSLIETAVIAKKYLNSLVPGRQAVVVGLYGDLGSGKTTFVQSLAKEFGVAEVVTSPTFVIEKIYHLMGKKFSHLIHIDAYRIEKSSEILHLGWKDIVADPKNLILIEWPERIADILPVGMKKISFEFVDETTREIKIHD